MSCQQIELFSQGVPREMLLENVSILATRREKQQKALQERKLVGSVGCMMKDKVVTMEEKHQDNFSHLVCSQTKSVIIVVVFTKKQL